MTAGTTVSIVIPTWNERENIPTLFHKIRAALSGYTYEIVVVDDGSPDGTAEVVKDEAKAGGNIRLIQRPRKLGLSSAVLLGAAEGQGAIVVTMDADLSHDPARIPALVQAVESGCDIAIGSRYVRGARLPGLPPHRRVGSRVLTLLVRVWLRIKVRDPFTGFAAFRREVLLAQPTRYSARGFKFLLEVLATQRERTVAEFPIVFSKRLRGSSKLGPSEVRELLTLCWRLSRWQARNRRTPSAKAK